MTLPGKRVILLTALFLLSVSTLSYGRVFARWRSSRNAGAAIESQGAKSLHDTGFTCQGRRGTLGTFSFEGSVADALRQVAKAFPDAKTLFRNEKMGQMAWADKELTLSWLAVSTGSDGRTTVFQIERATAESETSARDMPAGLPPYPNSKILFAARLDADGMALATVSTVDAPASVDRFYEAHLTGSGWMRAFPAPARGDMLGVYLRRSELCMVLAEQDSANGETRIAVLHKPQGVK